MCFVDVLKVAASKDVAKWYRKGGLVSIRHDDVRDEAGALAELVLPKTRVSYEPFIFHSAGTRVGGAATPAECSSNAGNGARGDVLVHGLWKNGESCILDVRVTDTLSMKKLASSSDAPSWRSSTQ